MISGIISNKGTYDLQDSIFENALIGMLLLSLEGRVLKYNKEAENIFGGDYQLSEQSFNDLFIINPPLDFKNWSETTPDNKNSYWENILQIKNKNQEVLWANIRLNRIENKKTREPLFLCQMHKIAASENSKDNYEYDHLLTELINNIPDNIFIKDTKSRFILANIYVAQLMGANSPKEILGKTDYDFYPKKLAGKYRKDEVDIIESGKVKLNIIEQVIDQNHNRKWFSTSKLPLKNNKGEIIGIMGIGRDITLLVKEQKALRKAKYEAEKADRLKSAFLANLSHEIRTPLNGILGFSQFLSQYIPPNPKAQKYVDFIMQNGKRLLHLISDIIDVSKIDSNQLTIKKKLFSLNEIFKQLEQSTREELRLSEKSHISLKTELSLSNKDCYIYNDDQRIKQVLYNLLSNAVKFTQHGSINFGYRIVNNQLYFFVKDSGIGIKDEDRLSIFELFTQVDTSLGRQYEGAGLGLSIAKGIIVLLGGKIGVNSSYGKGSEFYFTLPYINKESNSDVSQIESDQIEQKTILYIGKQEEKSDIFKSDPFLREMQLDLAPNEDICTKYLESVEYKPDIIICDMKHHKNWLHELIKKYLKNHPELALLLITDNRSNFLFKDYIKIGKMETINYPVNNYLMVEKIKLLLRPQN